jgi:hypothetical protein
MRSENPKMRMRNFPYSSNALHINRCYAINHNITVGVGTQPHSGNDQGCRIRGMIKAAAFGE